jgi:hypothetical protein
MTARDTELLSDAQLDELRNEYARINFVDPSLPAYRKLLEMLDAQPLARLRQLGRSRIKFVSGLALNRELRLIRAATR